MGEGAAGRSLDGDDNAHQSMVTAMAPITAVAKAAGSCRPQMIGTTQGVGYEII